MSQVKVSGNASGTGVFEIAAPNSSTNRTLTLPDNSGTLVSTGSSAAITSAMLATEVQPLGVGQTWQNLTASRAVATTYTNSTGRPITVTISATMTSTVGTAYLTVNGVIVAYLYGYASSCTYPMTAIIPAGNTYSLTVTNASIYYWTELR